MPGFLPSLLPSLGFLFSFIFMWSNNAHMFSPQSILVSLLVIVVCALIIFGVNYLIVPKIIQIFIRNKWHRFIFCAYISLAFTILFFCIVDYEIYNQRRVYALIILLISFLILYIKKEKILFVFFTLMLCFSSITLIKNSFDDDPIINKNYSNIALKKKPNIYLYWLESYNDFDVLKKTYNIDSSSYEKYLLDKKFIIGNNIYSSASFTLLSFTQLYSCSNGSYSMKGNLDIGRNYRNLIGGDKNNIVFRTLKKNGYKTFLLAGSYYYLYQKGEYLDEVNMDFNNIYRFVYPIFQTKNTINKFLNPEGKNLGNGYNGTLSDQVKTAMQRGKASGKPYIIAFKGGADHTPSDGSYTWKNREAWISSNTYQDWIQKSNYESEEIINYILENDPNSLIVLLGDHGSLTYYRFPWENSENYAKYNVLEQDVFDDMFRVLFAYRLPGGEKGDISHGMYMNNVNVFTHIFAYLAENPSLLDERAPSVSALPGSTTKMVEGRLVRE